MTKFEICAVLLRLRILVIYAFFPPNLCPQIVRVDKKKSFSNSVHDLRKRVFCDVTHKHTYRPTDGHCHTMTESAWLLKSLYMYWALFIHLDFLMCSLIYWVIAKWDIKNNWGFTTEMLYFDWAVCSVYPPPHWDSCLNTISTSHPTHSTL